jgi:hypothetical protein
MLRSPLPDQMRMTPAVWISVSILLALAVPTLVLWLIAG